MTERKITRCRLSGELFTIALECFSLYLQREDGTMREKWHELDEHEQAIIRKCIAGFYHHLED